MKMEKHKVPVALFVYNRPEITQLTFEAIRAYQPEVFFIIADGGSDEINRKLCSEVRSVCSQVDWPADVRTLFSETNLGCVPRMISGIDWVFSQVESAILLEDDCCATPGFFEFCEGLLSYYKKDEQVMHISGCNLLQRVENPGASYFFSDYGVPCWGWASWARAWKKFNPALDTWQKHKKEIHHHLSQEFFAKWTDTFEYIRRHRVGWDVPWNVDIWASGGVCIVPNENLVKNIGFGDHATFTRNHKSIFSSLPVFPLKPPLIHPADKTPRFNKELEAAAIQLLRDMD
jgi:hypothetical protein